MGEDKEIKNMNCVLLGCTNKAVSICNNCRIPICNMHGKRINGQVYLCINCIEYLKKIKTKR